MSSPSWFRIPDVQAVLAGENGVFDNAPAGALIIDFSSIRRTSPLSPRRP